MSIDLDLEQMKVSQAEHSDRCSQPWCEQGICSILEDVKQFRIFDKVVWVVGLSHPIVRVCISIIPMLARPFPWRIWK